MSNHLAQRLWPTSRFCDGILNRGVQRVFLNAADLATGPYFVTLTTAQGTRWTERLIVE